MKLAIMQPYFFPYIGYFQCIHAVDRYILYDNVNIARNKWVAGNKIIVSGEPKRIQLDLKYKSSLKKIKDINLSDSNRLVNKLLRSFYFSYSRSTYFEEIYPFMESLLVYETHSLSEFNCNAITEISKILDIDTEIIQSSSRYDDIEERLNQNPIENDYYSKYNLEEPSVMKLRVLEICSQEKATTYINAIGGQELYLKPDFKQNNIDLFFVKTKAYSYKQRSKEFHPHLSIIDILFSCGIQGTKELLTQYELI
jgi:hypothetical protein